MRADLPQGLDVARVRLHGVRHPLRPLLDEPLVGVYREDLAALTLQLASSRSAEPAEADDKHRRIVWNRLTQR